MAARPRLHLQFSLRTLIWAMTLAACAFAAAPVFEILHIPIAWMIFTAFVILGALLGFVRGRWKRQMGIAGSTIAGAMGAAPGLLMTALWETNRLDHFDPSIGEFVVLIAMSSLAYLIVFGPLGAFSGLMIGIWADAMLGPANDFAQVRALLDHRYAEEDLPGVKNPDANEIDIFPNPTPVDSNQP